MTLEKGHNVHCYKITFRTVLGSKGAPGARVGVKWWEKAVINLVGAREAVEAEEEMDGEEE